MSGLRWLMLALLAGTGMGTLPACDSQPEQSKGEDLTIVVEADRSKISQAEQELEARRRAFEQQRQQLRQEKARLMEQKEELADEDQSSLSRLKQLERRLWEKERAMWQKEAALDQKREQLAADKSELLDRVATARAEPTAAGGDALAERRRELDRRERDLRERARKQGRVADRVDALADRIAQLEKSIRELTRAVAGSSQRRPAVAARPRRPGARVGRKAAERLFRGVVQQMQRRGILWSDLPAELAGLKKEYYAAKKAGDFEQARDAASQLKAALSAVVIDNGFIDRKFARLNRLIRNNPPSDRQQVSALLRKATQLVGDGQHGAANRQLNRIFALLAGS
jgi:DNA repair exonuclease SbcCD ATPase subunit